MDFVLTHSRFATGVEAETGLETVPLLTSHDQGYKKCKSPILVYDSLEISTFVSCDSPWFGPGNSLIHVQLRVSKSISMFSPNVPHKWSHRNVATELHIQVGYPARPPRSAVSWITLLFQRFSDMKLAAWNRIILYWFIVQLNSSLNQPIIVNTQTHIRP